jgi:hypothetical protein
MFLMTKIMSRYAERQCQFCWRVRFVRSLVPPYDSGTLQGLAPEAVSRFIDGL